MAFLVSCLGADSLDERFETLFMRSISFATETANSSTLRSFSFSGRESEQTIFKAFGSAKLFIQGSLSFKGQEMETEILLKSPACAKDKSQSIPKSRFSQFSVPKSPAAEVSESKHEAALKVQKVYKSFRTRRQLADCAVLVEQHWWKLLDFALLKRSSVSFFDITKPESAVSRWSRARLRAAKVGKGLSKNEKAQKLALQHWLEAIDPRHRYGHNLHFYYNCWLKCESKQPFFYWLDVGDGREVNIEEHCPRSKLQQQCIKYLGPKEREVYQVILEDGMFYYKRDKQLVDTSQGPTDTKWIFVLSTTKKLYVGQKVKGLFQHSSFLAGGATSAAGRLVVSKGILKAVWPHSGHYRPTEENFQEFMSFLKENNVDLSNVKESPTDGEEDSYVKPTSNIGPPCNVSEKNPGTHGAEVQMSRISSRITSNIVIPKRTISSTAEFNSDEGRRAERSLDLEECQKKLDMPKDLQESEEEEEEDEEEEGGGTDGRLQCITRNKMINSLVRSLGQRYCSSPNLASLKGSASEQPYIFRKRNLFLKEDEEDGEASVPQELILRRINSKKGMKSLQLGNQLSCKWTTGAGPRIGIVRDYPSELQFRALEQVNLSPRSARHSRFYASPPSSKATNGPKTFESLLLEEMQR